MKFDIIGDIHGHADKLVQLLEKLGYCDQNAIYRHPSPDRKAIFVGDFIDRGPKIRDTLSIVKAMVDNGAARAVLGNHEYNALCYHTQSQWSKNDSWLRPRTDKNTDQHQETLNQFKDYDAEWKKYLSWFMTLPLFLDLDDIRIVHAAWVSPEIEKIRKWTSGNLNLNGQLLQKSAIKGSEEFQVIENVLKGVEVPLPEGEHFIDKDKNPRKEIRIRWWETAINKTYGEMIFPEAPLKCDKEKIDREKIVHFPAYTDSVPVFFGHYWLNPETEPQIQSKSICCLDYSVAKKGLLAVYCWQDEKTLQNDRFMWV